VFAGSFFFSVGEVGLDGAHCLDYFLFVC
jgi:hypothetical protein